MDKVKTTIPLDRLSKSIDIAFKMVQEQAARLNRPELEWRRGQTCFNILYELDEQAAEQIRGTAADPFNDDKKETLFWKTLEYDDRVSSQTAQELS